MKKFLSVFLVFAFVVGVCFSAPFTLKVSAASVSILTFELNSDGESYYVSDCNESVSGDLEIPSTYNGLPVTSIGAGAFGECDSLTSITIPDSVTSIGEGAFLYCTSLTSITIPDSVTSIGSSAFYNTAYYNDANNWENDVLYIGNHLIKAKTTLSGDYVIKSGTKCIAGNAFYDCTSLKSITIPDSVTSIGSSAFRYCDSLTSITIPDSVTSIGYEVFYNCTSLTSITIPDSVTSIGSSAFSYCTSLTSITIPDSVTSIGDYAFRNCTSLKSITIGDSVTSIGVEAFYKCTSLTSITIPDSVTSIGSSAFRYCDSLTSITIPDSVTSIGYEAFYNCTSLTSITIPDSVTSIGYCVFYNCTSLKSITIGDSVTSIGSFAFGECDSLTSITIPDSVTSIGDYAFRYCTSLKSITIGDSVTSIGDDAFYNCTSLESITIPDSVTSIGYNAFRDCTSLKYVFYSGSSADWNKISIGSNNSKLTSSSIHYNTTEHSFSVVKNLPFFEGMEGSVEEICSVCGFINSSNKLLWLNDYITAVDTKNVVLDTEADMLLLDISACTDISDAIIEMDGYTITAIPNSSHGFIGTGSKLKVSTTSGTQVAEYTLVVRGDVNGDSVCDVLDCMLIELARNHNTTLDGAYLAAGDLTENGEITVEDFSAVVNKALNKN